MSKFCRETSHKSRSSFYRARNLILIALLLVANRVTAQTDKAPTPLELGKPIELELAGGQFHSYTVSLAAGDYLHAVVMQRGVDVAVTLYGPDDKKLTEIDSPNGIQGPEPLFWVTETAGSHRLEVRSLDSTAATGRYEIKLEELRSATERDKSRVLARQVFYQAIALFDEGTRESLTEAIKKHEQALPLSRVAEDRALEAVILAGLADANLSLGETRKALDYATQALEISRAVGDKEAEASAVSLLGVIYDDLGEKQKALEYHGLGLSLAQAAGDLANEAVQWNNIGYVYENLGQYQKALDCYAKSLPLRRAVGDRRGEANTLNNIGIVYKSMAENQKALDYFTQALTLYRVVGDRGGEGVALTNLGYIYKNLGQHENALKYYREALEQSRVAGDRRTEATELNNIGFVYDAMGDKDKALDYYTQALPLRRAVGDRRYEAMTLNNIGLIYADRRENEKALSHYANALTLFRDVGDRAGEANTLRNVALLETNRGNLTEARKNIEAALSIVESVRSGITSQSLRASYFASVQDYYTLYIDVLMHLHDQNPSAGFAAAALQASERARARSLIELLTEAGTDIRQGVDQKLIAREHSLQLQLNAKAREQTRLRSGQHTEEQVLTVSKEIETLTTEYEQVESQIRQTSPRYAALTQPRPLSLKEIQSQVLDADTVLLEYSLGNHNSYLWAVTSGDLKIYKLASRQEIENAAREVYDVLINPNQWSDDGLAGLRSANRQPDSQPRGQSTPVQNTRVPAAAARLSQILLAPVVSEIIGKRLIIVADGALQYIPFSALAAPAMASTIAEYRPLILDHEIVTLPSASAVAVIRNEMNQRKPALKTVAVLADPVFEVGDMRVRSGNSVDGNNPGAAMGERGVGLSQAALDANLTSKDLRIPRLPGTRDEAKQIMALVPPVQAKLALDFEANRLTATSGELSQYRYVHFATHGFLDSVHPELSGIVLSLVDENGKARDGFLRAHEVYNLKMPAELVVLSACQTGLGKEIRGEGLVGLTRAFMYAGAPRVVVSLWSVNDKSTAALMVRFYRGMLRDKLRPAAALRAAQISLMKEKKWQSPYYWAAFTLQGEWR